MKKLNTQQEKAVILVALGRPGREIAETCEVTPETVSRWRQMPPFIAAVNSILKDAQDEVRLRLRSLTGVALDTIESVLTSEEIPPNLRLQAALKVLELNQASDLVKRGIGSNDPDVIEIEQQAQEIEQRVRLGKRRIVLNYKRDNIGEKIIKEADRDLLWDRA